MTVELSLVKKLVAEEAGYCVVYEKMRRRLCVCV